MKNPEILCLVCGSKKSKHYLTTQDFNQKKTNRIFNYSQCEDCKSIFITSIPDDLGDYYGQNYSAYSTKLTDEAKLLKNYFDKSKLDIVNRHLSVGKLVEIGPASGNFLRLAKEQGYDVLGLERDSDCVNYIKETLKIEVACTKDPAAALNQLHSEYDAVVAWHVIEHLDNLENFVSAASNALKPEGVMIFSAPNPKSSSFKTFKQYWAHLDAPRHLTLIPVETLDTIMTRNNLVKVDCIFDDPVGICLNQMGWQVSMKHLGGSHKILSRLFSLVGKALSLAMKRSDKYHDNGSAYTVVYRKKQESVRT